MDKEKEDTVIDDGDALEQLRKLTGEDLGTEPLYGEDEEKEKRVRHAFAKQKRALKSTTDKLEQVMKEERKPVEQVPAPRQPGAPSQSRTILSRLALRAMTNLGITNIDNEEDRALVDLEINRLYQEDVSRVMSVNELATRAENLVNSELDKYRGRLGDEGVAELQNRLGKLDVTDRVKPEVIRREVAIWVGEQSMSSTSSPTPKITQPPASEDGNKAGSAGRAVASHLKVGRTGVRPGETPPPDKPATEDELSTMRRLGFTDVKSYREAKRLASTKDVTI